MHEVDIVILPELKIFISNHTKIHDSGSCNTHDVQMYLFNQPNARPTHFSDVFDAYLAESLSTECPLSPLATIIPRPQ